MDRSFLKAWTSLPLILQRHRATTPTIIFPLFGITRTALGRPEHTDHRLKRTSVSEHPFVMKLWLRRRVASCTIFVQNRAKNTADRRVTGQYKRQDEKWSLYTKDVNLSDRFLATCVIHNTAPETKHILLLCATARRGEERSSRTRWPLLHRKFRTASLGAEALILVAKLVRT